jgi:hypothetical protein
MSPAARVAIAFSLTVITTGAPRALALASEYSSPCEQERSSGGGGAMGAVCIACLFSPSQPPAVPTAPPPRVVAQLDLGTDVSQAAADPALPPVPAEFFHPPRR